MNFVFQKCKWGANLSIFVILQTAQIYFLKENCCISDWSHFIGRYTVTKSRGLKRMKALDFKKCRLKPNSLIAVYTPIYQQHLRTRRRRILSLVYFHLSCLSLPYWTCYFSYTRLRFVNRYYFMWGAWSISMSFRLFVCLSVSLPVRITRKSHGRTLHIFVHVACGHDSVLFWRHCNMLCISGFMDNVMFSYHATNEPESGMM